MDAFPINNRMMVTKAGMSTAGVTTAVSNTSYFVYLGRIGFRATSCDTVCRVTTLAGTITWAEVGIFTGDPVANAAAVLTRVGFTDVAATFNTTGIKKTTIALSGVNEGDHVWFAYGSQATAPFILRSGIADDITSGICQSKAATRISTVAAATSMGLAANTDLLAWATVDFNK